MRTQRTAVSTRAQGVRDPADTGIRSGARILAADVGASKTLLGLFSLEGERLAPVEVRRFPTRDYASVEGLLAEFLPSGTPLEAACLGVAGPVADGVGEVTNLSWKIENGSLVEKLGLDRVRLVNDLEAMACGVEELRSDQLLTLNPGRPVPGHAALIAAGTGLGEAMLYWDGVGHRPIASEAGHTDFAPRNALEIALLDHLMRRGEPVSWEHVLSGLGLFNIYSFFRDREPSRELPAVAAEIRSGDPAPAICRAALEGRCGLCADALELFVTLYGAEAGNLALRTLARSGVYVGGGIAPRIAPKLIEGSFMAAFRAKDRMADLLADVPVHVVLEETTGLLGAARCAQRML